MRRAPFRVHLSPQRCAAASSTDLAFHSTDSADGSTLLAATGEGTLQKIPLTELTHSLHGASGKALLPAAAPGAEAKVTARGIRRLQGSVRCVALQSSKGRVLASTRPGQLDSWRIRSSTTIQAKEQAPPLSEHHINAMAYCAKTEIFALAFADGTLRWSDSVNVDEPSRSVLSHVPIHACSFRSDGRLLAAAGDDGDVRIWDALTGEEGRGAQRAKRKNAAGVRARRVGVAAAGLSGRHLPLTSLSCSPPASSQPRKGARSASLTREQSPVLHLVHRARKSSPVARTAARLSSWQRCEPHVNTPCCLVPAAERPFVASHPDPFPLQSGHRRFQLTAHKEAVNCVCFSSSGDIALTGSDDGTLFVHEMSQGDLRMKLVGHTGPVVGCAVVGDTKDPIAVSASADGSVMVWRTSNGALLSAFSPTGAWARNSRGGFVTRLWFSSQCTPSLRRM